VKLAVVVQRYGGDTSGGAELHARYIAERLSQHAAVEVLTTCARDYVTWQNELPAGTEEQNGVVIRRFPVSQPRRTEEFGRWSERVFHHRHSVADELRWLTSEGPASPELIRHVRRAAAGFDYFLFFSYRYYHAWHGARAVPGKAVLIPTAERDPALGLAIFPPVFRGVRAVMYNSPEEQALIEHVSGRSRQQPGIVVGVGSNIPDRTQPWRFRRKFNLQRPFAICIGRIDENKGCRELFSHFARYASMYPEGMDLVLVGSAHMPIPPHPRIRHLGFLPDADKFDGLAAADLLIVPSRYESLSMVTLEAWALGKPVLVNGSCDVLRGQIVRANGGLYYEDFDEFAEALYQLESTGPANAVLGRSGREYFRRHYTWPVIERKYLDLLARLSKVPPPRMEPLPGFFARRRDTVRPAAEVVAEAPAGPALGAGDRSP
jgi:glycosyltransferase involved in cell wall biosynthesis